MTTAIFTTAPAGSLRRHLQGAGTALRAFSEALFAAQDRQLVAQEAQATRGVSSRALAQGRRQLLSLAKQYDSLSPSLSAELRTIAGRD